MPQSVTSAEVLGLIRTVPDFGCIKLEAAIERLEREGIAVHHFINPVNYSRPGWFTSGDVALDRCTSVLLSLLTAPAKKPEPAAAVKPNTITKEHVADLIARSTFTDAKLGDKTTVVCMKLPNGFEITEASSCVDPANYDHAMGVQISKERMVNRVWQLEGYRLQCELANKAPREGDLHTLPLHLGHIVEEPFGTKEQVRDEVIEVMSANLGRELYRAGLTNFREQPNPSGGDKPRYSMFFDIVVRDPSRLPEDLRAKVRTVRVVS